MREKLENVLYQKMRLLAVLISFVMLFSSVPNGAEAATKKLKVTSPKTVAVNCSIKIKTNVKCKFKSSNKKIATVDSKGVVKGKKAGNVKITVTAKKDKKKKILKIAVKNQLVVTIPKASTTLNVGETVTIKTNLASTFKSDSASVTVTEKGVIRAESPGNANITVTAKQFSKLKKTVKITVIGDDTSFEPQPTANVAPTNTPNLSPTTPSGSKRPIGITAEYEGKLPINRKFSSEEGIMFMLHDSTILVKLRYDDNTEEVVEPKYLYVTTKLIEEAGIKYVVATVKFQEFTTELKVELVDVPEDVVYPVYMECLYCGDTLKENQMPNLKDIKAKILIADSSSREISSDELRIVDILDLYPEEGTKFYQFILVYDYYFYYNGEKLHTAAGHIIYIPYE